MTMLPNELLRRAREATGFAEPSHAGRRTPAAKTASSARRVPFALLVTGLIVGSLALLLALNTASAANELQRHAIVARNAAVAANVQDLRIAVAASGAPANLAAAADALGMVPAGNPAFVVVGADGRARVMGKPEAATAAPVVVPRPRTTPKPTPKPTPTPTPKPTKASAGTSKSPSPTRSGAKSRSGSPARPSAVRGTPRPTPTPTPTPTPVVTLPGGTR